MSTQNEQEKNLGQVNKNPHVHFSSTLKEPPQAVNRRLSFALDEASLNNLKNKTPLRQETYKDDTFDDDDEELFFFDEEVSEDDEPDSDVKLDDTEVDHSNEKERSTNPISASFKQSVFDIDKKYPWITKKRDTSKYLAQDFDIKKSLKESKAEEDSVISTFATSVPITITYPPIGKKGQDEEEKDEKADENLKKDILAKSFANYDFSYSDRLLSEQFPAPLKRRNNIPGSSSVINPQLHSLVGRSLDTRRNIKKIEKQPLTKDEDEDFDTSVPPHVWAANETNEEGFVENSYNPKK